MPYRFDQTLLDELSKRDNAKILKEYDTLNMGIYIEFQCSCGTTDTKRFSSFIYPSQNGVFCRECVKKKGRKKCIQTNLQKYGVEYPSQCEEFHKKQEETMLQKYGVKNPMQSKTVREKAVATNIKRYGYISPAQNATVKDLIKKTIIAKYGVDNIMKHKSTYEKIQQTNMQRYGVTNATQNPAIQRKIEQTSMQKYGTRRPSESATVRDKIQHSHLQKTGEERHAIQEKATKTHMQKYGLDSSNKAEIVKQHKIEANRRKYGVDSPMQNRDVQVRIQNRGFKHKLYKMPSGTIRKVQGFEPFALDELVLEYSEEQIITARAAVPRIAYLNNNKTHYYYPDIYIPHENRIIEVKSTWTYACDKDRIDKKAAACKEQGYNYYVWIYNNNRRKITVTS
jgi:hypothetical protein